MIASLSPEQEAALQKFRDEQIRFVSMTSRTTPPPPTFKYNDHLPTLAQLGVGTGEDETHPDSNVGQSIIRVRETARRALAGEFNGPTVASRESRTPPFEPVTDDELRGFKIDEEDTGTRDALNALLAVRHRAASTP